MKYVQENLDEFPRFMFDIKTDQNQEPGSGDASEKYCMCKGKLKSGYYVACEADEDCPNGGWLHPECTNDLRALTQEHIDSLDKWYCESCVERINKENEEPEFQRLDNGPQKNQSDEDGS